MKYKLEENINFFDELKNELSKKEQIKDEDNRCLLTYLPLSDNYITLNCSHKFNYGALFQEVSNQKMDNNLETTHLYINEMKCPYCRAITPNLLPYIPEYQSVLKKGVNSPLKFGIKLDDCCWKIKSGKNRGKLCTNSAYKSKNGTYCNSHQKLINITDFEVNEIEIANEKLKELNNKYTILSLRKILREKNLKIGGTKSILMKRLLISSGVDL